MKTLAGLFALISMTLLAGCVSAPAHQSITDRSSNMTVGKVQREIKIGMPSSQVAEILGSPNVVTTDEERREVWVYDKIASDVTYSQSSGYWTLILFGSGGNAGSSSQTQRTLTIVVKFDAEGKVRDFAYHSSKF